MPWNIYRAVNQLKDHAWRYFLDVAHFTRDHTIKAGKILSIHTQAVACIAKGKAGRAYEFGRVFQLGRIKGNFMMVAKSLDLRMNDKHSLPSFLEEHARIFGKDILQSVATDKGYWSKANYDKVIKMKASPAGMQRPRKPKKSLCHSIKKPSISGTGGQE